MIFRLDLTLEQQDDLMNYIGGLTTNGNYISDQYTPSFFRFFINSIFAISSIELQTEEFVIRYKKHIERSPMVICKGTKEYDVVINWFKPKMRDYKLEELGI
jgi:hypothetical protein